MKKWWVEEFLWWLEPVGDRKWRRRDLFWPPVDTPRLDHHSSLQTWEGVLK
jgi:hypothetical protein